MNEEAKTQMEAAIRRLAPSHPDDCRCVHCEDLRHGFRAGYAAALSSQWVRIEDGLPEARDWYIVTASDGSLFTDVAYFNGEVFEYGDVIAWMFCPAPFQEKADA